ncbi:hypothetical protein GEMRC1_012023 [Eukaryota sp. GEM-RC1]
MINKTHLPIWLGSTFRYNDFLEPSPSIPLFEKFYNHVSARDINPDNRKLVVEIMLHEQDAENARNELRYTDCIKSLERSLSIRLSLFPSTDPDTFSLCERITALANLFASKLISSNNFDSALDLLKRSEFLTEGSLSPFHPGFLLEQSKLNAALSYCQKALRLETKFKEANNPGGTHFNLAVILSQLGKHDESLKHFEKSLSHHQSELDDVTSADKKRDYANLVAAVHYNIGIEKERLHRFGEAIQCVRSGLAIAREFDCSSVLIEKILKFLQDLNDFHVPGSLKLPPIMKEVNQSLSNNDQSSTSDDVITPSPPVDSKNQVVFVRKTAKFHGAKFGNRNPNPFFKKENARRKSVILIQSAVRRFIEKRRYLKTVHNVVLIQSCIRRYLAGKEFVKLSVSRDEQFSRSHIEDVLIDPDFTSSKKSILIDDGSVTKEPKDSVVIVQRAFRSYQQRKKTKKLVLDRRCSACLIIQRNFRKFREEKRFKTLNTSCIVLQAAVRGHLARRTYARNLDRIVLIQKVCRKFVCQKQYNRKKEAAVLIQSHIRKYSQSMQFQNFKSSSLYLQSIFRSFTCRQQFLLQKVAAIMIQSVVRRFVQIQQFRRFKNSTITLQKYSRGFCVANIIKT